MRTIPQIIRAAGGAEKISASSGGKVKSNAVYKWQENGIPDRHWSLLIKPAKSNASELFAANNAVRQQEGRGDA